MHAVGIYLIYAAVVVRGVVRLGDMRHPIQVVVLLALYGLLLVVETWTAPWRSARSANPQRTGQAAGLPISRRWVLAACLLVQSCLVIGLLLNREVQDFYALLFFPLGLQAVLYFGRRVGFLYIAALTLAMTGPLVASQEGWAFGLAMVLNYGGLCFLLGGYAHQVRIAEMARGHTLRTLGELQVAHRRLQAHASQREDLAAEQERSRLARDLHDSVTQTVFGMTLTVQSARLLLERDKSRVADQLGRLEELAASVMGDIQTLISQLRPPAADHLAAEGLPAALRRLAAERLGRDGLQVTVKVTGERALSEPTAAALYQITQEALTNVAKHAGTRQATVRLVLAGEAPFLEIEDGGLGFDPRSALSRPGHLGLVGMAERACELGWSLSIDSHPACGTRIRVAERPPEAVT